LALNPAVDGLLLRVLTAKKMKQQPDIAQSLQDLKTTFGANPKVYFGQLLKFCADFDDIVSVDEIRDALQSDLSILISEARHKHPEIFTETSRPILLLDEVHRYSGAISPLFDELLPLYFDAGIDGDVSESITVPLILTASLEGPAHIKLLPLKEGSSSKSWLKFKELKQFDDGEDMLAYEQVLLNPFSEELYPDVSDKPWAFNYSADKEIITTYEGRLRKALRRIPADFSNPVMFAIVQGALGSGFVIEADDETLLRKAREVE
jgi:hypothetical protein